MRAQFCKCAPNLSADWLTGVRKTSLGGCRQRLEWLVFCWLRDWSPELIPSDNPRHSYTHIQRENSGVLACRMFQTAGTCPAIRCGMPNRKLPDGFHRTVLEVINSAGAVFAECVFPTPTSVDESDKARESVRAAVCRIHAEFMGGGAGAGLRESCQDLRRAFDLVGDATLGFGATESSLWLFGGACERLIALMLPAVETSIRGVYDSSGEYLIGSVAVIRRVTP